MKGQKEWRERNYCRHEMKKYTINLSNFIKIIEEENYCQKSISFSFFHDFS